MNNLELLSEYGREAWRNEVELLLRRVNEAQNQLHALK